MGDGELAGKRACKRPDKCSTAGWTYRRLQRQATFRTGAAGRICLSRKRRTPPLNRDNLLVCSLARSLQGARFLVWVWVGV